MYIHNIISLSLYIYTYSILFIKLYHIMLYHIHRLSAVRRSDPGAVEDPELRMAPTGALL